MSMRRVGTSTLRQCRCMASQPPQVHSGACHDGIWFPAHFALWREREPKRVNSAGQLAARSAVGRHGRRNDAIAAESGAASNQDAWRPWAFQVMKRPVQVVQIRDAYHCVRCCVLEQEGLAGFSGKVMGTVPKLAIENESLSVSHFRSDQVAPLVPFPSPLKDVFVGGSLTGNAGLASCLLQSDPEPVGIRDERQA